MDLDFKKIYIIVLCAYIRIQKNTLPCQKQYGIQAKKGRAPRRITNLIGLTQVCVSPNICSKFSSLGANVIQS